MTCDRCSAEAIILLPYAGVRLCETHLCRSIEKRVRRRIREDQLISRDLSPDSPETWVIGLSGGKDSAVLTAILHDIFEQDPRVTLVTLTIHEGIEGYRDESLAACTTLAEDLGIEHHVVNYEDEYEIQMDDIATWDDRTMAPCAYCGVFRRDVLERYASDLDADKLLTGHNLDDEAQTALMNFLEGDVGQMAKHHEASLGAFDMRRGTSPFTARAKPLRDIPEREVALYARIQNLPVHMAECPHASEAYRGEIQSLLHALEDNHPGTRHSIMAGYEQVAAAMAQQSDFDDERDLHECKTCGSPTVGDRCRSCELLDVVAGAV